MIFGATTSCISGTSIYSGTLLQRTRPLIRKIISGPISYFPFYFFTGYTGISVYGKNWATVGTRFVINLIFRSTSIQITIYLF